MLRPILVGLSLLALASAAGADPVLNQLPFSGYSYSIAPSSNYPDSGGELTDGTTFSIAWGNGNNISLQDVAGLVGWLETPVVITFTFAGPVTLTSVSTYFADSDGAAGVSLPLTVTLGDGGEFTQTFNVDNPTGSGSTIESVFDGFSITTDTLTLTYTSGISDGWTMLAEVQAFGTTTVPEPATTTLVIGAATLALVASRRRRS